MSNNLLQAGEVSGLTKIEAEDLLDLLEAAGYEFCQLSFVDGEGFCIRPELVPRKDDVDHCGAGVFRPRDGP